MTLNKFIISDNSKVREALELINEIAIPNMVVFVTNENNQLVGSLTDGDIRRGFLKGFNLDDLVLKLMNINPKYFVSGDNNYDKMNLFKSKYFRFVPVLDSEHKILE